LVEQEPNEAAGRSETGFDIMFNLMPDPVVVVNGKGKFLAVNDKVEEKTGFKREELLGRNFLRTKIATAKSKAILIKNLMKRMVGVEVGPYEIDALTTDGEKIPCEVNAARIEYGGGPADIVIFRDITERRKAEEELRQSEQRFRDIAENAYEWIWEVDTTGKFTYSSSIVKKILGYEPAKLLGKHFYDLVHPEDQDKLKKTAFDAFAKKKSFRQVLSRNIHRKGRTVWLLTNGVPILDDGELVGYRGSHTDVTELKRMEEQLRQYSEHLEELVNRKTQELVDSEKTYSVLMEELSDGVAISQDGKIVFANRKAAEFVGYSKDELIGKAFEGLVDTGYLSKARANYQRRIHGEEFTSEFDIIPRTGKAFPVEVKSTVVNYRGRPAILAIVRDIRKRKELEEQRVTLEKLATAGELATMVGHDLRNPLQSIENAAYFLQRRMLHICQDSSTQAEAVRMLQVISDSIRYADKIIRDLDDFSAEKRLQTRSISVTKVLEEALSRVVMPGNIELVTELAELPTVQADQNMVERTFLNLVTNSIQAMEVRGGRLTVSTRKSNQEVEVAFQDTGVGISEEHLEKIFNPFFTTKAKGLGMGLAICKKFVESHGGSISVQSEEGKGSTFTVALPICHENGGEDSDKIQT
jgi:PAS domain S-box-containing protein